MMKQLILIILTMSYLMSSAQESIIENKDVRVQGYLFTITTLNIPINNNNGTISIPEDRPKRHFFIPLSDMLPTFKETLEKVNDFKSNYIYLPLTLTESKRSIQSTNSSIKYYLKTNALNLSQLDDYKNFRTKSKTTIRVMDDETERWIYNIVYIDGIWEKLEVPFKWVEALSIGHYHSNCLDKNHKEGYDYYFLKDINVISYDLDINEKGLVVIDN